MNQPLRELSTVRDSDESWSIAALVNPINHFRWMAGLAQGWFLSRDYRRLASSIPFWIMMAGVVFFWWVRHAPDDTIVASYTAALEKAVLNKDKNRQEVYLNALVQLRPGDPQSLFGLAIFLLDSGRKEGLTYISQLAPNETDGYAPARMWLVRQASRPEPLLPLTESQIESQLLKVLSRIPDEAEAHRRLAEIYERKSEFKLAEYHLEQAARAYPELSVGVARIKEKLNRDPEDIRRFAERGADELTARFTRNRADIETRIALANALVLLDKDTEAQELLAAGIAEFDHPKLRRALSNFDLTIADQRLQESALNYDASRQIVENALAIDPSNAAAIQRLAEIHAMGVGISEEAIQPAMKYWQEQFALFPDRDESRLVLSQLLTTVGKLVEGAEILGPLLEKRPDLRLAYAQMLWTGGKQEEATILVESLIQASNQILEMNPADVPAAAQKARALMISARATEAKTFLETFAEQVDGTRSPKDATLGTLYGRTCLDLYDRVIPPPDSGEFDLSDLTPPPDSLTILQLLADAGNSQVMAGEVINRLSRLAVSRHPAAAQAEEMVRKIRVAGDPEGTILNLMGANALFVGAYAKARTYLEQSNELSRGRNPMTLNNLAIAKIRGEPADLVSALELVNQALGILQADHPDALMTRAEIHIANKDWKDAFSDLQKALPLRKESKELHQMLQQVYEAQNQPDMAEEHRKEFERLEAL